MSTLLESISNLVSVGSFQATSQSVQPVTFSQYIDRLFKWTLRLLKWSRLYTLKNYKKPGFILSCVGMISMAYVITPTISAALNLNSDGQTKRSKRPDKYTTGFNNTANDCFANATIQSLVPLSKLNEYFNAMIAYPLLETHIRYPMPLHLAMISMLGKLQEPIHSIRTLNVWDLLHLVEQIHQGKISRAQHDAHELLLMIIDTLEDEYLKFFSFISKLDEESKKKVTKPPHFPFSSIVESKLRCMRCKQTSVPVKNPMMMMELTTPQTSSSTSLETIISNSQSEVIEGYSCLVCMVKSMIFNESTLSLTLEQSKFLELMKRELISGTLKINDDYLEDPLYKGIIASTPKLQLDSLKSVVHREVQFVETPEIIPIHLSRSIFSDTQSWRNACAVKFPLELEFKSQNSSIPIFYQLKSVIRHQGSHSSGHYECYRRKPQFYKTAEGEYLNDITKVTFKRDEQEQINKTNGKKRKKLSSVLNKPFWRISDSKVTEVSEETVLSDGKAVYLLIYEQVL